jgi:hypothetical protein
MKKAPLIMGIILIALTIMAPGPPDKAEKLKIDDSDWDISPSFDPESLTYSADIFGVDCKFGIATAGEHADFQIRITLSGVKIEDNDYDNAWSVTDEVSFHKDPDDIKDEDGYIGIDVDPVSWNGDDDGGFIVNEVALALIGPNESPLGDVITVDTGWTLIGGPSFDAPVMIDGQDWDYDPDAKAIIVPLLADADLVGILQEEGYQVRVDVDVWNLDGSEAGSGSGQKDVVKVDPIDWDYVQIQPALAVLDDDVEWNGDDDGSGIVSGSIELITPDGSVVSTITFEGQVVGFVIH